jgi:hypothetical protein
MRRALVATAFAGAMVLGGASPALAQQQDGLVNVIVEDNEILSRNNVAIGVAAQIAAEICGLKVGPVAVLATQVDRSGGQRTVCTVDQDQDGDVGKVILRDNR